MEKGDSHAERGRGLDTFPCCSAKSIAPVQFVFWDGQNELGLRDRLLLLPVLECSCVSHFDDLALLASTFVTAVGGILLLLLMLTARSIAV